MARIASAQGLNMTRERMLALLRGGMENERDGIQPARAMGGGALSGTLRTRIVEEQEREIDPIAALDMGAPLPATCLPDEPASTHE